MMLDQARSIDTNAEHDHESDQVRSEALDATGLKDWFVCIVHVSYLLPSNMRHVLGVVNDC